jgi:hypothetical protein
VLSSHPPNFPLFKYYFCLKYQPSVAKKKVIGGVSIQSRLHCNFLDLPLKTSLKGWHKSWFYCEKHEPSIPPFVNHLPEYNDTWVEEPTVAKMPLVTTLANRVNELKELSLTRVSVAANWLVCQVMLLKKQVHPGWEYSGVQDSILETSSNLAASKMVVLL